MASYDSLWSLPDRTVDAVAVGIMVLPLIASFTLWSQLPTELAIHWSGSTPNTFVTKPVATLGLFTFGVALIAAIRVLPNSIINTPGGTSISVLFLGGTVAWVQLTVLVWNLGYQFNVAMSVAPIMIISALLVVYSYRYASKST